MNYKQVIIDALFDANAKPFFAQYIFRKMQEAKKVNYGTLEFFNGCIKAIEALEGEFIGQLNDVLLRMEDQLEMCVKKGSEKAAKRIQEQRDFITEDNFQMGITGYGGLSKYDIDLAKRGVADAIELAKGGIGGLVEKIETIRKRKVPLSKINDPFLLIQDVVKRQIIDMYEGNLRTENIQDEWLKGDKIELCAAFCNKLYEGNFFKRKTLLSAIAFAHGRYGVDISAALDKLRRKDHSQLLIKKENEIMRIATGNKYGKMEKRIRQK